MSMIKHTMIAAIVILFTMFIGLSFNRALEQETNDYVISSSGFTFVEVEEEEPEVIEDCGEVYIRNSFPTLVDREHEDGDIYEDYIVFVTVTNHTNKVIRLREVLMRVEKDNEVGWFIVHEETSLINNAIKPGKAIELTIYFDKAIITDGYKILGFEIN